MIERDGSEWNVPLISRFSLIDSILSLSHGRHHVASTPVDLCGCCETCLETAQTPPKFMTKPHGNLRVECPYCHDFTGAIRDYFAVHVPVCRVECTRCGMSVEQAKLEEHQTKECVFRNVVCPMAEFGCAWTGSQRAFADEHEAHCPYIALRSSLTALRDEVWEMNKHCSVLWTRLSRFVLSCDPECIACEALRAH